MQDTIRTDPEYRVEEDRFYDEGAANCDDSSSADELETCAANTRRSVDQNLRELEDRVSPKRVLKRVRENLVKRSSQDFNLDRTVGRNPVPFAIIGSGLILVGAGLTAYAVSKLRNDSPSRRDVAPPERFAPAPHPEDEPLETSEVWAEPEVAPVTEGEPFHAGDEDDASTEDLQKKEPGKGASEKMLSRPPKTSTPPTSPIVGATLSQKEEPK